MVPATLLFHQIASRLHGQQRENGAQFRRLLWLQMDGGASDIDTFNPKPARGQIQPLFNGIRTSVPGIQISEEFPEIARIMHFGTLFRARVASSTDHLPAMQTQLGTDRNGRNLLEQHAQRTHSRFAFMETPDPISAFPYRRDAFHVQNGLEIVRQPDGTYPAPAILHPEEGRTPEQTLERIEQRNDLLKRMEKARGSTIDAPAARRHEEDRAAAMDTIRQAVGVVDGIDARQIQRYCGDTPNSIGLSVLRATELIRSGLFWAVIVRLSDNTEYGGWDTHGRARNAVRHMGPRVDRAVAEAVKAQRRGQLRDTLIVLDTEFGRSVRLDDGGGTGRNHRRTHCSMLFHPSVRGGAVIGDIDGATGEPVGAEAQGVVDDALWADLVKEALMIPRERRNFPLRERVPMFETEN